MPSFIDTLKNLVRHFYKNLWERRGLIRSLFRSVFWLLTLFTLGWFLRQMSRAHDYSQIPVYSRVHYWLKSAEATQKSKSFLTIYDEEGHLFPIETLSHADDRGHTLMLNLLTYFRSEPPTRVTLVRFNLLLNMVALLLFGCVSLLSGFYMVAVFGLLDAVTELGIGEFLSPDVTATYVGLFLLSITTTFMWRFILKKDFRLFVKTVGFILCLAFLGLLILFRQPIGMIGIVCVMTIGILNFRQYLKIPKYGKLLLLLFIAMTYSVSFVPKSILFARNKLFNLPKSEYTSTHGFSHILYIGLGVTPNPWNIRWADDHGAEVVEKIDPSAPPSSNRYFEIIGDEYKKIVRENPKTVLNIYWEKTQLSYKLLGLKRRWVIRLLYTTLLAGILYFFYSHRFKMFENFDLIAAVGCANLLVLLQGILGLPDRVFVIPMKYGLTILVLLWLESLIAFIIETGKRGGNYGVQNIIQKCKVILSVK